MTLERAVAVLENGMCEAPDDGPEVWTHVSPSAAYEYAAHRGGPLFGGARRRKQDDEVLLAGFLELAAMRADRLDRQEVASVLHTLIQATISNRPRSLEILNEAAVRASRLHEALQRPDAPPDVESLVAEHISASGARPGIDALQLAEMLCRWLHELNPEAESDVFSELQNEIFTSESESIRIRAALPSRLVINGRVFVSDKIRHRAGASPRKRETLCRCPRCSAKALMRAAERVMGARGHMTFPKPRKNARSRK